MALSPNTVVEVRSTGNDNNGGGFVTGASGTDFSQQDSAQYSFTDLASTNGTGAAPQVSSASHNFVAADVGNLIQITAGTNWVAGFYQIVSVASNQATLDRACGTTASLSAGTYAVGGALATPAKALLYFVGGNGNNGVSVGGITTYIKAATYALTTAMGFGVTSSSDAGYGVTRFVGYTSSRGDNGKTVIQSNASSMELMTLSGGQQKNLYSFENIIWDGNNQAGSTAVSIPGNMNLLFINCIFKNFTGLYVISNAGHAGLTFYNCDFTNNSFAATNSFVIASSSNIRISFYYSYFANNAASGSNIGACLKGVNRGTAQNCIFYNNTGTAFNPILADDTMFEISNCIFHSNGSDAIKYSNSSAIFNSIVQNNIFTSNGGYGINMQILGSTPVLLSIRNNAYYNNSSGSTLGFTDGGGNQTLTGLPYINAPSDFALNNNSGQGAKCRNTGIPGTIGSAAVALGAGYEDIGALHHIENSPIILNSSTIRNKYVYSERD